MSSLRQTLSSILKNQPVQDLSKSLNRHACVAVILKGANLNALEVGYIQRAHHPDDRWSGQIAFPGGIREEYDSTDLDAALRETAEEVGIHLEALEVIGSLDDIQARKAGALLDFYIRPFIFYIEKEVSPVLDSSEVADFFWIPLQDLTSSEKQTSYKLSRESISVELPAISLSRGEPPLWGLTYMMTQNLLQRLKKKP